ncbi:MAG: GIY-YIG nuclease family protein, partial [Candidatus Bathyarchaeia archaeon]
MAVNKKFILAFSIVECGMRGKKYYVYMLECATSQLYVGFTTNLKRRLKEHNGGRGGRFTRGRTPVRLIHSEEYGSRRDAIRREIMLKRMPRLKKIELAGTT